MYISICICIYVYVSQYDSDTNNLLRVVGATVKAQHCRSTLVLLLSASEWRATAAWTWRAVAAVVDSFCCNYSNHVHIVGFVDGFLLLVFGHNPQCIGFYSPYQESSRALSADWNVLNTVGLRPHPVPR